MEITRRSDYACRMIRAAYHAQGRYISVAEVSSTYDIPYAFARSIQHDLVHAGILRTVRGARGGLALACNPATTTLLDVLEALQGNISCSACSGDPDFCTRSCSCVFHKVWKHADDLMREYLSSITLQNLFAQDEHIS